MGNTRLYDKRYEKINKESKWLFNAKLIITCFFSLIALTLYLLNYINFPAVCLILLGAIWNFFVDINTLLAFLLSILVGFLFAMFAIIDGLYANAVLYVLYYIPLQFVIWLTNPNGRDMSIKKDKKLSKDNVYYICVSFILGFAAVIAVAVCMENEILLFFDAFSACMLGLSAFLQSYMYREYYSVRIVAVILSIILWSVVLSLVEFSMGAIGIIVLYSMYLITDVLSYISWFRASLPYDKDAVEELDEDSKKKLVQEKVEEYNMMIKNVKVSGSDDKGVKA